MTDTTKPSVLDRCLAIILGEEGGYTDVSSDPGNWTGGQVGKGTLRGTKYGISAEAYPTVDIANLTQADASAIYRRDYWTPIAGDALPAPLALLVLDAAINNGVSRAKEWLQAALGVATDGDLGPQTMAALAHATATDAGGIQVCAEFLARRIDFEGLLSTWKTFGLGWSRRLAALPWHAMAMTQATAAA